MDSNALNLHSAHGLVPQEHLGQHRKISWTPAVYRPLDGKRYVNAALAWLKILFGLYQRRFWSLGCSPNTLAFWGWVSCETLFPTTPCRSPSGNRLGSRSWILLAPQYLFSQSGASENNGNTWNYKHNPVRIPNIHSFKAPSIPPGEICPLRQHSRPWSSQGVHIRIPTSKPFNIREEDHFCSREIHSMSRRGGSRRDKVETRGRSGTK